MYHIQLILYTTVATVEVFSIPLSSTKGLVVVFCFCVVGVAPLLEFISGIRACFMSPPFFWMFHRHRSAAPLLEFITVYIHVLSTTVATVEVFSIP